MAEPGKEITSLKFLPDTYLGNRVWFLTISYVLLIFLACSEVEVCHNSVKRVHLDLMGFLKNILSVKSNVVT